MTAEPQSALDFAYDWSLLEHAHAQHIIVSTRLKAEGLGLLIGIVMVLVLAADGVGIWFSMNDEPRILDIALPITFILLAVLWVMVWGNGWIDAFRQRRTDSSLEHPIHIIVGGHGLRVRGKSGEVALRWRAMKRVYETREFVLFYYTHGRAYYLPKRVTTPEPLAELRELIRTNVGDAAELQS